METVSQKHLDEAQISLKELLLTIWADKWLIAFVTAVITLTAGIAAWITPETFRAEVVISPASDTSSSQLSSLSSLTSQFSGLASLAGISISGDSKKSESLAVLQSEALTEKYIKDNNLLPILYESKWDSTTKKWNVTDPGQIPTLWKANELFKKKVRIVSNNTKTGMVTLTISWKDPVAAATWANDLVRMANDYMRSKAISQSEKNIAYLNEQAAKADAVGAKQAIYSILQTEINKVMLARGSDEYAFKIIDPAVPPEKAHAPQKAVWIFTGLFGGFLLSLIIVYCRWSWTKVL